VTAAANTPTGSVPAVSVVIPVFNEERSLVDLHHRLSRTLKEVGQAYEIVFVDDGSTDGSFEALRALHEQDSAVRVVRFNRNYGQHAAVFAGMQRARGEVVVTLDADLQDPPEDIPLLLERAAAGVDVVGGWRVDRQHRWFRRLTSWTMNRITSVVVGVSMQDYGCMLRAYRRPVVDRIVNCQEVSSFIPVLAVLFAGSTADVPVGHAPRREGKSRYGLFRYLRLGFDLLTGFSLVPIQFVSLSGIVVSAFGLAFAIFLGLRRLVIGPEVEGVFTLFAVLFMFVGLQILALGLIGEYVGRIYQEVRRRPRYVVREVLE
jgi:undecaprenyl-phosphate 4-deoxy-4-formamido-L-arabinose transferase